MLRTSPNATTSRLHALVRCLLLIVAVGLLLPFQPFVVAADDPAKVAFFETRIRPVLIEHCYKCHSAGDKTAKGGLRLDSRERMRRGGDSGPAIVPGKPEASRLIKAIRYDGSFVHMPPKGKLPETVIADFHKWIESGAADPREESVGGTSKSRADIQAAAASHWAYQPLRESTPPAVRDGSWPLGDVDRHLLAKLESKGLRPSPDANRHAWLRRVSLDLAGLPPTPEDIQCFVSDPSADAWAKVVDRLLASRGFGERWARHWLDLVGYADQIGSANNVPAEHAWRYRDYVIRAFHADKPFNEFIREQLAGDLLTASDIQQRQDQLIATGFLVLGNVNIVEADKLIMNMDLIDRQIEKVGKAFLGLTLNCARCHDHKFDPITLRDYYGMAGIFASTEATYKTERGVWSSVVTADLPETLEQFTLREAATREHDRKTAAIRKEQVAAVQRIGELDALIEKAKGNAKPKDADKQKLAEAEKERAEVARKLPGYVTQLRHLDYLRPAPPRAFAVKESPEISDTRVQVRGNPHVLGDAVQRGFIRAASFGPAPAIPKGQSGRLQLAEWLTGAAAPLTARVTVNRTWQKLFGRGLVGSTDYFGLRGELPSHPELLDHLAAKFIRDGWSQKQLIRQIVLSRAYRQSAEGPTADRSAMAADPENRRLWRMSPRRLDAETLRDTVLAASGGLVARSGGPALVPEFIENVGGLDPKDVNPISFSLRKFRDDQLRSRTIYLPVVRSSAQKGPAELLDFFDFPQPAQFTGERPTTTVSTQALFLLNGPLVKEASQRLASQLIAETASEEARLASLYLRVLNRPITAHELGEAHAFLVATEKQTGEAPTAETRRTAWQRLVHALLISNEFLFRL